VRRTRASSTFGRCACSNTSTPSIADLVYYFDFEYKDAIDDGDHRPSLEAAVERWKNRRDVLSSTRVGSRLVIRDTRPVATWPETVVTGIDARIYEYVMPIVGQGLGCRNQGAAVATGFVGGGNRPDLVVSFIEDSAGNLGSYFLSDGLVGVPP
jgi:hypothetical protein